MNFCTSCGQPRTAGARFCTSCGTPFAADAGDEPPPVPSEPQPDPQPWQTPLEAWPSPQDAPAPQQEPRPATQQEPWAGQPDQPAGSDQPIPLVQPAGPAPEENWAAPQDTWAPQQDAPTPPQGTWVPQPDAPAPPAETWAAQPDAPAPPAEAWAPQPDAPAPPSQTWAAQQDTLAGQQDTWGHQQETWAAPPGAGFAAEPGAGFTGQPGAGPDAADDPFAHFFRDAQGQPAGQQGGFGGQQGPGYGETMVTQPPYPGEGPPGEEPPRRSRARAITLLAGVVVVLAAGGVGAWAALGGKGHPSAQSSHTSTPHSSSPQPSTSAPSSTPKPSPGPSGMVAAAPGVTGKKGERAVLAFLDSYFTAINTHNYQKYYGLLDAQQQRDVTQGQFDSGYRKTRDSHATLVALGPAGGGVVAAAITFTSHQPASDSPSHTSCTNWNTTLYLRHQGGSYVIGAPPASYHASYQAC